MLLRPFQYKRHGAARKIPTHDLEGLNVDQCFKFSIQRMEVRRKMIAEIHLNQDTVKPADRWLWSPRLSSQYFRAFGHSIQRIDRQTAEQLGEEVGGLLRHHVAGKGHFLELLHRNRIGEEGYIGLAAPHLIDGFSGIAQIA